VSLSQPTSRTYSPTTAMASQLMVIERQMQNMEINRESGANLRDDGGALSSMDVLEGVFRHVDGYCLGACMQVCQVWLTVCIDEKLWSNICELEQVPVLRPRPSWFRTFTEFSAGSWRFVTSDEARAALRAAMPLLPAMRSSLFSWVPMEQPRWWQWGDWSLCNLNEVLYIMSTIGCSAEDPVPWLVIEIVANSNGWFRFAEKRVPVGHAVSVAWESNDIDDEEQPFEKPVCGATAKLDAPLLPNGLYRGGIPQYHWDVLVRPRQLFVMNPDGILEFRKHAMGVLFSDRESTVLFPRPGRASAHALSTWLMSQSAEDDDDDDYDEMDW